MRKNRFLTFLFSLVPGCGHMYLGYMKRGVEFMAMFAASVYLSVICINIYRGLEMAGAIFLILLPIIWLYQMFDSMHALSRMRRLEMQYADDDGFFIPGVANITNLNALNIFKKSKVVKTIAVILICVGIYALFSNISNSILNVLANNKTQEQYWQVRNLYDNIMSYVPSVIISFVLILLGIKLLKGKKNNDNNNNYDNENGGE